MGVVHPAFRKDPRFLVWSDEPLNGEPPSEVLADSFATPTELFYVRCHGAVPKIDPAAHRLVVDGLVEQPLELDLAELPAGFESFEISATLHCAGNRRTELAAVAPIPGETPWHEGAIGNARWSGVRLADVLAAAGLLPAAAHVELLGRDTFAEGGRRGVFGGSIPVDAALDASVLLATRMNGEPLEPEHGSPLRAVVPGYIGARSVKWLQRIVVRDSPSENFFQAHSYKLFPRQATAETVDWNGGTSLGPAPLNSVICRPHSGAKLDSGPTVLHGWASAGPRRVVARVDVSLDDGRTWAAAEAAPDPPLPGTWRLWRARVELEPGEHTLVVRAEDDTGATQPADVAPLWNFKGYANNAWHRVPVEVRRGPSKPHGAAH
jgi:sulfite oxidase